MDAVKFLKERNMMCKTNLSCCDCPAYAIGSSNGCKFAIENWTSPEQQVEIIERWLIDHPHKTRQSNFLELFPDAHLDSHGVLNIQPCDLGYGDYIDCSSTMCYICRERFWDEGVN